MDKRFLVFYALAAAVLLWLIAPNSMFALFSAMLVAVGCGALEGVHRLFRPASFGGAVMALAFLVGRTGILSAAIGGMILQVAATIAFCLLAFALAALETDTLGSSMPALLALVLTAVSGICGALLGAGLFPAAAVSIGSVVTTVDPLAKIVLLLAVLRAQRAVIRKGE
ncbi:MAG: hypothetical protein IJ042_04725 [Butyricicoccus sp.]|nr:hypothetical protein [Butyricicoccus sp.]